MRTRAPNRERKNVHRACVSAELEQWWRRYDKCGDASRDGDKRMCIHPRPTPTASAWHNKPLFVDLLTEQRMEFAEKFQLNILRPTPNVSLGSNSWKLDIDEADQNLCRCASIIPDSHQQIVCWPDHILQ